MKNIGNVLIFIAAVIFIAVFDEPKSKVKSEFDSKLAQQAELAAGTIDESLTNNQSQNGAVLYLSDKRVLSERVMQNAATRIHKTNNKRKSYRSLIWNDSYGNAATISTFGVDKSHHFVNSYLVGIRPFKADNDWLPLYTLAQRKTYQLDSKQYGVEELWQNSAQAFKSLRGDCEDHAIALADWLISEGVDARVVIGTYQGSGHAWVVAFKNAQAFILEATSKRTGKSWSHYPLASLAKGYKASYMFNRTSLWKHKNGDAMEYMSKNWKELSRFRKAA